jgi:hypothetical protein
MELNKIKEKLSKEQYSYFSELQEKIGLPLFFMGSITRSDYIKGKSDLDIEIFSDNVTSTKEKLNYLFNYYEGQKENTIIIVKIKDVPFSGYKYKVNDSEIEFDLTLYKKESQKTILYYRIREINVPFTISAFLIIIKFLHYRLNIINERNYYLTKKCVWEFYNSEKVFFKLLNDSEYKKYYNTESQKKHLV